PTTCLSTDLFFSSRRRHTRCYRDWSSDVCSSDLPASCAGSVIIEHTADNLGTTTIVRSMLNYNTASTTGGGVYNAAGSTLTVNQIGRASCRERVWISGLARSVTETH